MGAHIELLTAAYRAGKDFKEWGDPYTFSATIVFRDKVAELIGASGELYNGALDELKAECRKLGVSRIIWERKKAATKNVRVLL
jgi:hypothetical protein